MVRLPWGNREVDNAGDGQTDDSTAEDEDHDHLEADPLVACEFQDGTLYVYEDQLFIERTARSKFDDKWIALDQVTEVRYASRFIIGYIQITQLDFENSEGGRLSSPVGENTLHFGHGKRSCAQRARDEILERLAQQSPD